MIVTAIFLLLSSSLVLDKISLARGICRQQLIQTQSKAAGSIDRLLALNPPIKTLYARLVILRAKQLAAMNPVGFWALPKLEAEVQKVKKMQRDLGKVQSRLLKMGEAELKANLLLNQQVLQRELMSDFNKSKMPFTFELARSIGKSSQGLAVREVSMPEGPPVYELDHPFTQKQAVAMNWKFTLKIAGSSIWKFQNLEKSDSCSVSLKGEPFHLKTTLHRDKPQWSLL